MIPPAQRGAAAARHDPVEVGAAAIRRAWILTGAATVAALGAYLLVRSLPVSGGSLHYSDFQSGGKSFLEFCEPGSPQFAPVDRVRSPVTLELRAAAPAVAGRPARATVRLAAASGKPVTAADLLVVHTQKLHLLVVDESLDDYHHLHPAPAERPGEWTFEFTPRRGGRYRVFADFTPRATGRALYAGAEMIVTAAGGALPAAGAVREDSPQWESAVDGIAFRLRSDREPLRIHEPATLTLTVRHSDGSAAGLEPVMGAAAHLVAFDAACSGFAHLHPAAARGGVDAGDGGVPDLSFLISVPDPGYYRVWAQVRIAGRDVYAPFGIRVEP